jgi:hypothetical protein
MKDCDLKLSARDFGLTETEIADVLEKWGPAVLKLIIDGLNEGFSLAFIKEILTTLGPLFLTQAIQARLLSRNLALTIKSKPGCTEDQATCCEHKDNHIKLTAGAIIQGGQVEAVSPLAGILVQVLIQLLQTEGPQVAQLLVNLLIQLLQQQQNQQQLVTAINQALTQTGN